MQSRFERQVNLNGFGEEAQRKLRQSSVLVIGVGGLGCPALQYLSAAGFGRVGLADGDRVEISNLNRQILFSEGDLGKPKATTASRQLSHIYPDSSFIAFDEFIRTKNVVPILSGFDIILDGSDNFETRYLINDACALLGKALVFGAVHQSEGQISVFHHADEKGRIFNYRDLHPDPPSSDQIPNCQQNGVLGVLPGTLGVMMATEAIKIATGYGRTLAGKMLYYNLQQTSFYEIEIGQNEEGRKKIPHTMQELESRDYNLPCIQSKEMDWAEVLKMWIDKPTKHVILDVRELHEKPELEMAACIRIPLQFLKEQASSLASADTILIFCQSGGRSREAAAILNRIFPDKNIFSIKGGIDAYAKTIKIQLDER